VFKDWEDEGIMERVSLDGVDRNCSYFPHRPVIKETSKTTPVRPVFDASCRSAGHASLNECLEKGPNLLEVIPSIISRFRWRKIGVVSDIRKAFLQIQVKDEDRDYLRFLWWEDESKKIVELRHCRVVFGVTSSPFLLAATINHHLDGVQDVNKETIEALRKSFYVDNCVTSVESLERAQQFAADATMVMARGRFELRGWEFTDQNEENNSDPEVPVLGMIWNKHEDILGIDLRSVLDGANEELINKRSILSRVQRIFDPIDSRFILD
jgi:hypothetical protein